MTIHIIGQPLPPNKDEQKTFETTQTCLQVELHLRIIKYVPGISTAEAVYALLALAWKLMKSDNTVSSGFGALGTYIFPIAVKGFLERIRKPVPDIQPGKHHFVNDICVPTTEPIASSLLIPNERFKKLWEGITAAQEIDAGDDELPDETCEFGPMNVL